MAFAPSTSGSWKSSRKHLQASLPPRSREGREGLFGWCGAAAEVARAIPNTPENFAVFAASRWNGRRYLEGLCEGEAEDDVGGVGDPHPLQHAARVGAGGEVLA